MGEVIIQNKHTQKERNKKEKETYLQSNTGVYCQRWVKKP